jgi:hypothetical protein
MQGGKADAKTGGKTESRHPISGRGSGANVRTFAGGTTRSSNGLHLMRSRNLKPARQQGIERRAAEPPPK